MKLFENRVRFIQWCWCPTKCWYIRAYPNPGFGFPLWGHKYRIALSVHRGFEIFISHPRLVWSVKKRYLNRKLNKVR